MNKKWPIYDHLIGKMRTFHTVHFHDDLHKKWPL